MTLIAHGQAGLAAQMGQTGGVIAASLG